MTHPNTLHTDALHGLHVVSSDGEKIGKVSGIYNDVETDKPEWAAVKTGFFGGHETLVPLVNSSVTGDELTVPYSKDQVKEAPHHDPDDELSNEAEAALFTHYGVPYHGDTVTADGSGAAAQVPAAATTATTGTTTGTSGARDTSGPNTDDAMTRSEQQLVVGKQTVETGKARLRKYVVTENVSRTVPVAHEEVRIEREPITEANRGAAMSGKDLSEEEVEVTLHAEKAVAGTETVPVERVRLATETVQGEETVNQSLGKEVIETVGAEGTTGTGTGTTTTPGAER